jgi:Tfp pilus assembly protein PilO
MKSSDRTILLGLVILGAIAAFWFLMLAPKRAEVTKLDDDIALVQSELAEQEAAVAAATQARDAYEPNYHRMVVLGKAVPTDADTSSLFVQLDQIAAETGVDFDSIELAAGGGAAQPAAPAAAETTADQATPAEGETASTPTPASEVVPATEAGAADLPLGATVGPAGLPVMPYSIKLTGDFFQLADFMASLDELVQTSGDTPVADGRLITVDSFELAPNEALGFPVLDASLEITTFVTPADQGATAGATEAAPAPATAAPLPASTSAEAAP